jgi:hypothetical protein
LVLPRAVRVITTSTPAFELRLGFTWSVASGSKE